MLGARRELGIGFMPFSRLGKGFLTGTIDVSRTFDQGSDLRASIPRFGGEALTQNAAFVDGVSAIADAEGVTPGQLALAGLLARESEPDWRGSSPGVLLRGSHAREGIPARAPAPLGIRPKASSAVLPEARWLERRLNCEGISWLDHHKLTRVDNTRRLLPIPLREDMMNERITLANPEVDVLVVGSVNEDRVTFVQRFPRPGETVSALAARRGLGGKGANQAVAAVRAGASVRLAARVGDDGAAVDAVSALRASGVIVDAVEGKQGQITGSASIAVDADGENWVIVDPGANACLTAVDVDKLFGAHGAASVVLSQGETPVDTVVRTAQRAHALGMRFVLNLAPVIELPADTLGVCDPLVVNEHEGAEVAAKLGLSAASPRELVMALASVARSVVVTLGAAGAAAADHASVWTVAGFETEHVVDTTGAGDAFVGSLCARLAAGDDLVNSTTWASAAASLSVERPGAAESYASADEIGRRLLRAGFRA